MHCCKLLFYTLLLPLSPFYFIYKWCKRQYRLRHYSWSTWWYVYRPRPRKDKVRVYKHRRKAKEGFLSLVHDYFACFNQWCCCAFSFTDNLTLADAISRYQEVLPPCSSTMFEELVKNENIKVVLDYLNSRKPKFYFRVLPAGSIRERFGYKVPSTSVLGSDYDLMLVPDSIYVYDKFTQRNDNFPITFTAIDDSNQNPERPKGYLWLELNEPELKAWKKLCFDRLTLDGVKAYLSQLAVLDMIQSEIGTIEFENSLKIIFEFTEKQKVFVDSRRTGPALNITISTKPTGIWSRVQELLNVDFTIALPCPIFPRDGKYFLHRREDNAEIHWPDENILEKILQLGCHVVPKPSKKTLTSLQEEQMENSYLGSTAVLEWRYSFSQAEMLLADNIPEIARITYLAFKATIKAHVNHIADHEGKFHSIPSYVLKTILFYEVESRPAEYWERESISVIFLKLLVESLSSKVQSKYCPHYWIEGLNLFQDMEEKDFQFVEARLKFIKGNYVKCVASEWLEWNRFVRNHCCDCCITHSGDENIIVDHPEDELSICRCCVIPCSSDKINGTCLQSCSIDYDSVAIEVY